MRKFSDLELARFLYEFRQLYRFICGFSAKVTPWGEGHQHDEEHAAEEIDRVRSIGREGFVSCVDEREANTAFVLLLELFDPEEILVPTEPKVGSLDEEILGSVISRPASEAEGAVEDGGFMASGGLVSPIVSVIEDIDKPLDHPDRNNDDLPF